jgi:hypothetical protein
MKKKQEGRPRITDSNHKRSNKLGVLVVMNKIERDALDEYTSANGVSASGFMRKITMEKIGFKNKN